jgi:hypothetical protein
MTTLYLIADMPMNMSVKAHFHFEIAIRNDLPRPQQLLAHKLNVAAQRIQLVGIGQGHHDVVGTALQAVQFSQQSGQGRWSRLSACAALPFDVAQLGVPPEHA